MLAQCPDNSVLWKRLIFLRDSAHSVSTSTQLAEFVKYDASIKNCSFPYDSTQALLLQRIGAMHFRQGDYLKSMQYMLQSVNVVATNWSKPSVNRQFLIVDYYSLSLIYGALGLNKEKIAALDSCEILSERLHYLDALVLHAIFQKVEYYLAIGDYHRCISYADKCSNIATAYYASIPNGSAKINEYVSGCFVWKINALTAMNDYSTAERLLLKEIEEYGKARDAQNLGAMYALLAQVEVKFGKYQEAISYFRKAIDYDRKTGFDLGCKASLTNLAYTVYFSHYHDYGQAQGIYRQALRYISKNPVERRKIIL